MNQIKTIHYQDSNVELDIIVFDDDKTIWLNQKDLAVLYGKSQSVISRNISKLLHGVYANMSQVYAKYAKTGSDGKQYQTTYYNMDVILALGYAFRSEKGSCIKAFIDGYYREKNNEKTEEVIIYNDGNVSLDVRVLPQEETVWLTQNQIAILFETTQQNISLHINNILKDGEVDESTHKEYLLVQNEGERSVSRVVDSYNLDMILSVGYRIKSKTAIRFRKWATKVLKQYLIKGYVIDDERAVITKDNYINLYQHIESLDARVANIEKINKNHLIEDKVIFENQIFDALVLINRIIETASSSIIVIDPYVDINTLNAIKGRKEGVVLSIITSSYKRISKKDINAFVKQYGQLSFRYDNSYHDRYLIIDKNLYYHIGTSLNYLGKRFTQITLIKDKDIIETLARRCETISNL